MNVAPLIIDTPIDWDEYRLTDDDRARVVTPGSVVEKALTILKGGQEYEGVPLPFGKSEDRVRLRRGKLSVWGGINHHGKTWMLKQVALNAIRCGETVGFASLEETPEETLADLLQLSLGMWVQDGDMPHRAAAELHGKLWLYDQQGMVSADRILALMTYMAKAKGCTHMVIDSLMRLGVDSEDNEAQRVFVNRLTAHARLLNVHAHLVCHVRKQSDETAVPSMFGIRGSGSITDQADNIFVVWRDKREDRAAGEPVGLLVVEKQRGRPNWIGRVRLWRDPSSGQFLGAATDDPRWFLNVERFK